MNKIPISHAQLFGVYSSSEFYKRIGMKKYFDDGTIEKISQIKINPKTWREILAMMTKYTKENDISQTMNKKEIANWLKLDWTTYSPKRDKCVPEWEVWFDKL